MEQLILIHNLDLSKSHVFDAAHAFCLEQSVSNYDSEILQYAKYNIFVLNVCPTILIYQGVHRCTKVCNLDRTVRVVIQPESSGWCPRAYCGMQANKQANIATL